MREDFVSHHLHTPTFVKRRSRMGSKLVEKDNNSDTTIYASNKSLVSIRRTKGVYVVIGNYKMACIMLKWRSSIYSLTEKLSPPPLGPPPTLPKRSQSKSLNLPFLMSYMIHYSVSALKMRTKLIKPESSIRIMGDFLLLFRDIGQQRTAYILW